MGVRHALLTSLLFLLCAGVAHAALLNPSSTSNGCSGSKNYSDCYDELVNNQSINGNVTRLVAGAQVVPWFGSSTQCGVGDLKSGASCNIGTVDFTNYCIVSDEESVRCLSLANSRNETGYNQCYTFMTLTTGNSGVIPTWRILANESNNTLSACDSRVNSNCDTASDATARYMRSLYSAANNTFFTNTTQKQAYGSLARNMTRDMLAYEVVNQCYNSTQGFGPVCYWLAAGSQAKAGGLGATDFGYSGYYADGIIAFLQGCAQTGNMTYCAVAGNLTLNYLQAANYSGTAFTVPPGRSFKWTNVTGGNTTPVASCTGTCSPDQWDAADAPRALGMCEADYYAHQVNITLPRLSGYCQLWNDRYLTINNSAPLQYFWNGTASAAYQSGYFAQGLQSLALTSTNQTGYETTLRSALSHYTTSNKWDSTACFGVYNQGPVMRSLFVGIGRDLASFPTITSNSSNSSNSSNATVVEPFYSHTMYYDNGESGSPEDAAYNWTAGTYSTDQHYDGLACYAYGGNQATATNTNLTNPTYPVRYTVRLYDLNNSAGQTQTPGPQIYLAYTNASPVGGVLEGLGDLSTPKNAYVYDNGSGVFANNLTRSLGWHNVSMTYYNTTWVEVIIDTTTLYNSTIDSIIAPSTLFAFGAHQNGNQVLYLDQMNVSDSPNMTMRVTILNFTNNGSTNILGFWAQASSNVGQLVDYQWTLFVNGALNTTGNATNGGSHYSSNVTVNLANVSASARTNYSLVVRAYRSSMRTNYLTNASLNITSTRPTMPNLSITNSTAYVNGTLVANASNSSDIDGDAISYYYEFFDVNASSIVLGNSTVSSISINASQAHHVFRVRAYANDSTNLSVVVEKNFTINNTIPNITAVALVPLPAIAGTNLSINATCTDLDGDTCNTTVFYAWYKNGVLNSTITGPTFGSGNFTTGDNITGGVRFFDGFGNSTWQNTSTATIGDNVPPVITAFALGASSLTLGDSLNISANCTDNNYIGTVSAEVTDPQGVKANFSMANTSSTYSYAYAAPQAGTYSAKVYCTDGNGNVANTSATSFTVIPAPAPGSTSSGGGNSNNLCSFVLLQPVTRIASNPLCPTGGTSQDLTISVQNNLLTATDFLLDIPQQRCLSVPSRLTLGGGQKGSMTLTNCTCPTVDGQEDDLNISVVQASSACTQTFSLQLTSSQFGNVVQNPAFLLMSFGIIVGLGVLLIIVIGAIAKRV